MHDGGPRRQDPHGLFQSLCDGEAGWAEGSISSCLRQRSGFGPAWNRYNVQVPIEHLCCGRPLYDYGFLDRAKRYLTRVLDTMQPAIEAGTPMVVLEPSCCSVFRDELNGLMPDSRRAHRLMENTFTLSEFLQKKAKTFPSPKIDRK